MTTDRDRLLDWIGWLREGQGRWRAVCSAQSREECWTLLLRVPVSPGARSIERTTLPRGKHPGREKLKEVPT